MGDFKQRITDWREYKAKHKTDFMLSRVGMTGYPLRNMWWFLMQPIDKRLLRERQEIEELEGILEEARVRVRMKENKEKGGK